MFLVGLTGGIASGKSTVSAVFKELGIPVIEADVIAREVVEPGKPAWKKLKEKFGRSVIQDDGTINRQALGEIIFNDKSKRDVLNNITHPYIYRTILWEIFKHFICFHQFLVIDLPLMFESGIMLDYLYKTVVVSCEQDQQLARLMARNQFSEDEAKKRIKAQMPLEEKCNRANVVIDNSGTEDYTKQQVILVNKLLKNSQQHWWLRLYIFGLAFCVLATFGCMAYIVFRR